MAPSIGVNLRVTGHCNQGRRKYMEDAFAVAYQQTGDERDLEYAYFGIFDGHGGREAALFAKENLLNFIVGQKNFWSDDDETVLKSIKEGFVATHMAMWKQVGTWPQTVSGLPSTSGTTASVVFIRKGKMYVGHVGDSAIVLGYKEPDGKHYFAQPLTRDHKPESPAERKRIENVGGSVINKCGVQRVVWNRPRIGHKGPIRRSTHIDQIPFLAVARSLGDLWSYDYLHEQFVVSPEPDVSVVTIDPKRDRCIILATDGVWNMLSPEEATRVIEAAEHENERHFLNDDSRQIGCKPWFNPSRLLVDRALNLWASRRKRADNTSVVTVMLDPPGPPRSEVLLRKRMLQKLRPRDETEAGPSMDGDWREQQARSRVMVAHELPSPGMGAAFPAYSSSAGTTHVPGQRGDGFQNYGFLAPHAEHLPQKTRLQPNAVPFPHAEMPLSVPAFHYRPQQQPDTYAATSSYLRPFQGVEMSDACRETLRTAPTPPLPDDSLASPGRHPLAFFPKPVPLQRASRHWGTSFLHRRDSSETLDGIHVQHQTSEALGQQEPVGPNGRTDRLERTADFQECSSAPPREEEHLQTLDGPFSLLPQKPIGATTRMEDAAVLASTAAPAVPLSCKEKDQGSETSPRLKRKLPPGSRELFTLMAKQTRFATARRDAALWGTCRLSSATTHHITRSRMRLRKAQA